MNLSDAAAALGKSGKARDMEKLDAIEQAQQAVARAQSAVARCRAALERVRDIVARRRVEYQAIRAEVEERIVRAEILKTGSAWRERARTEEHDQLSSADKRLGPRP
jgi:hypothetical protein